MRLVSFDPLQTLDIPGVRTIKPAHWFREKETVKSADWILYPEYWQVNPLYYGLKKRIFPSVSTYHIGHDKIEMARAFEAVCPENAPVTRILPRSEYATEQILDEFDFPFVVKEVRSSMGEGVFLITDKKALKAYVDRNDTLFVQEYLPISRDLRVVVVGKSVVAAYWRQAPDGAFCNNVSRGGTVCFEDIPDSALGLVEKVAIELDINHAGFDVAVVDGHGFLLEFNPRFGTQGLIARGIRLGRMVLDYLIEMSRPPEVPGHPRLPRAG
ncbi:MAG: ATP-grasp domain-containing protein [Thermodesulfobacteriota bacterium]|nr:ATP-grasp domain-containing protein [Thermodesulfobacteriota bacterium]